MLRQDIVERDEEASSSSLSASERGSTLLSEHGESRETDVGPGENS